MQSNRKAVCIIPLPWLRYSFFRGLQTQLFIIYFSLKPAIHYSLFSFHPRERTSQTSFQKMFQLKTAKLDDISDNAIIGDMKLPKEN